MQDSGFLRRRARLGPKSVVRGLAHGLYEFWGQAVRGAVHFLEKQSVVHLDANHVHGPFVGEMHLRLDLRKCVNEAATVRSLQAQFLRGMARCVNVQFHTPLHDVADVYGSRLFAKKYCVLFLGGSERHDGKGHARQNVRDLWMAATREVYSFFPLRYIRWVDKCLDGVHLNLL